MHIWVNTWNRLFNKSKKCEYGSILFDKSAFKVPPFHSTRFVLMRKKLLKKDISVKWWKIRFIWQNPWSAPSYVALQRLKAVNVLFQNDLATGQRTNKCNAVSWASLQKTHWSSSVYLNVFKILRVGSNLCNSLTWNYLRSIFLVHSVKNIYIFSIAG